MDDFLKLKLDKLQDTKREEVLQYLLGITEDKRVLRSKQYDLDPLSDYTEEAKAIQENWGRFQGISSGYDTIDKLTKGFVGGELTVIAAKTTVGKTALAVNIANRVALKGTPVLFVTLEMTRPQLTSRFLFINGGDTDSYRKVAPLVVMQRSDELDWKSIDGLIGNFCKDFTNGFVVIDHLHYFTRELENVSEDLGRITKELKKNAIRHNVPVVLISHVRKSNGRISIEDLRGSSYVAQDADIVLLCGRSDDGKKLGVRIEKNRNRGYDYDNNEVWLFYDQTKITELPW